MSPMTQRQPETSSGKLAFHRLGLSWPHRGHSRFVSSRLVDWHLQVFGPESQEDVGNKTPVALLLHGTGSSAHSWRGLAPLLASDYTVIVPDLPGHSLSHVRAEGVLTLPGMAGAVADLARLLEIDPSLIVGHSAGVAVGLQLVAQGAVNPDALVGINGALLPFSGLQGHLFAPMARMLASSTGVARFLAWRAGRPDVMTRLLDSTGSRIGPTGRWCYQKLLAVPDHVQSALTMMSGWDLEPLNRRLDSLNVPVHLVTGALDRMVPPRQARDVAARLPRASVTELKGLGHLAHEEDPQAIYEICQAYCRPGAVPGRSRRAAPGASRGGASEAALLTSS
ncbi:MAG: alpha/beta fold hydrolase [Xanthomonadales bacterium]|nr:alpha/beta fold hydrolase [Xanthomonadales bacterium]